MKNLESAYQFDEATLQQNQKGQINDAQRDILAIYSRNASRGIKAGFVAGILSVGLIIGSWAMSNPMSRNSFQGEATAFSVIAGVFILVFIYGWITYRRITNRLNKAEILHIEGEAKKSQKQHGKTKIISYHVRFDSVDFQLDTKKKWEALQDGAGYRVHYIDYPPTNIVLSVEPL